jgi:hypothetical protein
VADVLAKASRIDLAERVDRLEEDRCLRAEVGMIVLLVPMFADNGSLVKKWSEVDDVVEATDAVCARSADSSRVRRLTYRLLAMFAQ